MENFEELYCVLCYSAISNGNLIKIDHVRKVILEVILLKLDFDAYGEQVMCKVCSLNVMEAFKFKSMCIYTDSTIISYIGDDDDDKAECSVDLIEICTKEKAINPLINLLDECKVCRLCMQLIRSEFISVCDVNVDMINNYIPEINFSIVEDPVICRQCFDSFDTHSSFIKKCLEVEKKHKPLLSYTKTEKTDVTSEVSGQEVTLRTELTVVKSEDENMYVKTDSIKIETEENDERKPIENLDSLNSDFNISNDELGSSFQIITEEVEIKHEENLADSVVFDSEGLNNHMDECDVKMDEQHVVNHKNMYNCALRDFSTMYQRNCKTRMTTHNNSDTFKLRGLSVNNKSKHNLSNYKVKCNDLINRHQKHKGISDVPIYKCCTCNYKTKDKNNLVRHEVIHKTPCKVHMLECDFKTKCTNSLVKHQLVHKDPFEVEMYQCDICDFKTKHKSSLVGHQLKHKDPSAVQMYGCDKCDFRTKHKRYLVEHELIHKDPSDVQMYECDTCDFKTMYKRDLVRHQLIHKDSSEVQLYECDTCDFRTIYKHYLVRHQLIHKDSSEVQLYECDTCDYRTKYKSCLAKHQLIHKHASDVQMYECDTCDFRTRYKSYHVKHQLIHKDPSKMQMYKCDKCGYRIKDKNIFIRHQLIHKYSSEVQLYECDICDFRTQRKSSLLDHQLKHKNPSEVQMYQCDICDFKAAYKCSLVKHQLTHKDF